MKEKVGKERMNFKENNHLREESLLKTEKSLNENQSC